MKTNELVTLLNPITGGFNDVILAAIERMYKRFRPSKGRSTTPYVYPNGIIQIEQDHEFAILFKKFKEPVIIFDDEIANRFPFGECDEPLDYELKLKPFDLNLIGNFDNE